MTARKPPAGPPPTAASFGSRPGYVLRLYVSAATPASARAVVNARRLCEAHLKGCYQLEILNIFDHVAQATQDQIVAAPTLLKLSPLPVRRFIGDLSDTERVLKGLDVGVTTS